MKQESVDKHNNPVVVGSKIRVLEIDNRIISPLPKDEVEELESFIGNCFEVKSINSDGSMVVSKEWEYGNGHIMGHDIAIFPIGAELVTNE